MAPNKKKKKATNPSRGFATTSFASKSKIEDDVEATKTSSNGSSEPMQPDTGDRGSPNGKSTLQVNPVVANPSPEELENQWEESELQLLLEQHSERVKKDASRQISRLRTEKRLLTQADHLLCRSWLPEELMQLIESSLKAQREENILPGSSLNNTKPAESFSENILLTRLWTLERTLIGLGFKQSRVRDALRHLIHRKAEQKAEQPNAKDASWGLEEIIEWLALYCDAEELPSYTDNPSKNNAKSFEDDINSNDNESAENIKSAPENPEESALSNRPESLLNSVETGKVLDQTPTPSSESEVEEPKAMIASFLDTLSRLYSVRPDIADLLASKRNSRQITEDRRSAGLEPRMSKIIRKISRMYDDILFDSDQAQREWIDVRSNHARDAAERRKLQLDSDIIRRKDGEGSNGVVHSDSKPKLMETYQDNSEGEDEADLLGGLFTGLSELTTDNSNEATTIQTTNKDNDSIVIRDFGSSTGLKPRRVLEETCKAR